mgnify:CR=1 FL=1
MTPLEEIRSLSNDELRRCAANVVSNFYSNDTETLASYIVVLLERLPRDE